MKKTLAIILVVLTAVCTLAFSASAAPANTWGKDQIGRFDGNEKTANKEIAYRFATRGTGKLIALNPYMSGTDGSFDVYVYNWSNNYEETVAQTPVDQIHVIYTSGDTKFLFGADKAIEFNNGGLPVGEYLIVMKNFTTEWAICNFYFTANPGFKVYTNGVGEDKSLQWQLVFEDGGWYWDTPLSADVATPVSSSTETSTADTNTPEQGDNTGDNTGDNNNPSTSDAMIAASALILLAGVAVVICKGRKD